MHFVIICPFVQIVVHLCLTSEIKVKIAFRDNYHKSRHIIREDQNKE